ncbi:MAG: polysaccharide pyruvyl transferase family protein [Hyphomicrobiaceae bacterium]
MLIQNAEQLVSHNSRHVRPERIALLGHFGTGNLGNEGSLEAILAFLRKTKPEAEIHCICVEPDVVKRDHGLPGLMLNWRPRNEDLAWLDKVLLRVPGGIVDLVHTIGNVRRFDYIIVPGTGILDDFGVGPIGMPYGIFKWSVMSRLVGSEFWLVSIGAGPIHHPISRFLMKWAARLASLRSYRDEISRDYMIGIGSDASQDPVFPDVAFGLPVPSMKQGQTTPEAPLTVGVGVMTYYGWMQDSTVGRAVYKNYLNKLEAFATWLLDNGHFVRILMGEKSDLQAVNDLKTTLSEARPRLDRGRVIAEVPHDLHDIMRQIGEVDLVVATRFHNVVCALKAGRPTISLGYAKKNEALLADMGCDGFSQSIEEFDVDKLKQQFRDLSNHLSLYQQRIAEGVARLEYDLVTQGQLLSQRLGARTAGHNDGGQ